MDSFQAGAGKASHFAVAFLDGQFETKTEFESEYEARLFNAGVELGEALIDGSSALALYVLPEDQEIMQVEQGQAGYQVALDCFAGERHGASA